MIEPTIKEIVRFHELNENLCFEDNLTKEEQDEINSLEKIIMPFNCIAIMNDEIEKLKKELETVIKICVEGQREINRKQHEQFKKANQVLLALLEILENRFKHSEYCEMMKVYRGKCSCDHADINEAIAEYKRIMG